jgi:hypothetical protein
MEREMRHPPGSIAISADSDVLLMRTVYRAGHATFHQLYTALHPVKEKRLWDTLNWRIGRLVKHKFLDRTPVEGLSSPVFSLGENGELCLQGSEKFLVERAGRSRGANKRHQIWHDVELFDIQLALRRAGVVVLWESEPEVKAVNDFTTDRYAKDYDAVVTFQSGHRCGKVAIEYERTPKWSKTYERICAEIDIERKLDTCLYLVPNRELLAFLLHALQKARSRIVVTLASEFVHSPHTAAVIDVRTSVAAQLRDCLAGPDPKDDCLGLPIFGPALP